MQGADETARAARIFPLLNRVALGRDGEPIGHDQDATIRPEKSRQAAGGDLLR